MSSVLLCLEINSQKERNKYLCVVKKVVAILLSLIILSGACKELITYAQFHINKDFIVNNFCVNLNKPETKCGGTCYLKKSLIENQAQEERIPNQAKEKESSIDLLPISKSKSVNNDFSEHLNKNDQYFINNYSFSYLKEIFQPPRLTAKIYELA